MFGQHERSRENLISLSPYQGTPGRYLGALVQSLVMQGWDCGDVLRRLGVSLDALLHGQARLHRQDLNDALQTLSILTGRSDLGFDLGNQVGLRTVDGAGQLFFSARTLGEGLILLSPYVGLVSPSLTMACHEDADGIRLEIKPSCALPYDVLLMVLECAAVATHRLVHFLTAGLQEPYLLNLAFEPPSHVQRYRDLAGVRVRFGLSGPTRVQIWLPRTHADAPLITADECAVKLAQERCRMQWSAACTSRSWSEVVCRALGHAQVGSVTALAVARQLGMSTKTLHRRLADEGASFRKLAAQMKGQRAMYLLTHTPWPLHHIAEQLGYSDASNFSRAFERQFGRRPGDVRTAFSQQAPG